MSKSEMQKHIQELQSEIENLKHETEEAGSVIRSMDCALAQSIKENKNLQEEVDKLNSQIDTLLNIRMELLNKRDELEKQLEEREPLPLEPIEVAKFLINATYEYETSEIQRKLLHKGDTDTCERYTIDELEQIAEHLLIYCKHNKGCEE